MTLLSRSARDPEMISVSCDVCYLPLQITNRRARVLEVGWQLSEDGPDVCTHCREARAHLPVRWEQDDPEPVGGGRLPDLAIIGAAKAGTTSLHTYLDRHPEIGMAELKELRFFADPHCAGWERRYRGLFPSDARLVGESSTMYTRAPALPGVPERMRAMVPDIRLIYVVREPVQRALASYVEERFHGLEPRTAAEAFADLDDPYNPYVAASRYGEQVERYLEHFPRDQILVLTTDELGSRPAETMRRVFGFLDVDPAIEVRADDRVNERASKRELVGAASRLQRSAAGRAYRRIPMERREWLSRTARRVLTRQIERPVLEPDQLDRLRRALAPDVRRFEDLTGVSPAWATLDA